MSDNRPKETGFAQLKQMALMAAQKDRLFLSRDDLLALVKCADALKELSAMYAMTWDRVDGALVMMDTGVTRFEDAHAKARASIKKLEAL